MCPTSSRCSRDRRFHSAFRALPRIFPDLFPADLLAEKDGRHRVYPRATVLEMALEQCLAKGSCASAVQSLALRRAEHRLDSISMATGGYCRAKARLPQAMVDSFRDRLAAAAVKRCSHGGLWRGLKVKFVDGTTVSMPDTPANKARWPHANSHKKDVGFPTIRMSGLFCMVTGMLLGAALGPYQESEVALARTLFHLLSPGDLLVRDRGFSGYGMLAQLFADGIHSLMRIKKSVKAYHVVRNLGPGDQLIRLRRPKSPSNGMSLEEYKTLPGELELRLITVTVQEEGFRTQGYRMVTTLTNPTKYPAAELAELYRRRWEVEIDILRLKEMMPEGELRARSPKMVELEFSLYQLAYNLVRTEILGCGKLVGLDGLQRVSFKRAKDGLIELIKRISGMPMRKVAHLVEQLAPLLARALNRHRPGRAEPRAIKKKKKDYPRLRVPRSLFVIRRTAESSPNIGAL